MYQMEMSTLQSEVYKDPLVMCCYMFHGYLTPEISFLQVFAVLVNSSGICHGMRVVVRV